MDRAEVQPRFEEAQGRVERGEQNIAHQRSMIEKLERGGHDARAANLSLQWLLGVQARDLKERDRLLKELGES
ncbi:MAG: hypothetical protein JO339_14730 [Alphaproteobacteria bacterium]|nr:hypothetical protein [Alphaproteobacteria bacterium]